METNNKLFSYSFHITVNDLCIDMFSILLAAQGFDLLVVMHGGIINHHATI